MDITESLKQLKEGKIILCPTDTVWGLSCDATNDLAVQKIIELKRRPSTKSFIVLVSSLDMLGLYVNTFPDFATDIIEYAEKPLTVIFPIGEKLSQYVINQDKSVAIRLVKPINEEAKFCYELIRRFNKPIVSTSANIAGEKAPEIFSEISSDIKEGVDYIVPYFQKNMTRKQSSKIIRINEDGTFKIIR